MTVSFVEGALRIRGPDATRLRKFDDVNAHTFLGPMKAVDFIVELDNYTIFLEIKDPDNPNADSAAQAKFAQRLYSGSLDEDLKYKFRDSYLYEWSRTATQHPIVFVVVIQYKSFVSVHRLTRQEQLRKKLPARHQAPSNWLQFYLEDVLVMDCQAWNRQFPSYRIDRIP